MIYCYVSMIFYVCLTTRHVCLEKRCLLSRSVNWPQEAARSFVRGARLRAFVGMVEGWTELLVAS